MALVTCMDCQKQVSTMAASCPHCGAPKNKQRTPMVRPVFAVALLILLGAIAGMVLLGKNGRTALAQKIVGDIVVVDRYDVLQDGYRQSWKLEPGMYRVELTANGDGVTVDWVAADCSKATFQTQSFSGVCELSGTGQLVIMNPTLFGLGQASNVSTKITRLAR